MTPTRSRIFLLWVISIATIVGTGVLDSILDRLDLSFPPLGLIAFLAWCVFICLSLYYLAAAFRFILRKLFWRVGRRLTLSYFLIGVLPFIFFTILILVTGYLGAAILSQTTFRMERLTALQRLDQWNLEYALSGARPSNALPSLEVYDSRDGSLSGLPDWLRRTSYVGLVSRDGQPVFVSARRYEQERGTRSVVFAQPLDEAWSQQLESRSGMLAAASAASEKKAQIDTGDGDVNLNLDDEAIGNFLRRAWGRSGVVWGDLIPSITDWDSGEPLENEGLFVIFSNPWSNLLSFYFGSSKYVNAILGFVGGVAGLMAIFYSLAVLLAAVLIFSISRAVNRIEKGTRAVERGDFSYRIGMKPSSQLGEVATSFDRMTESISGLLNKVAEQERLQSEIDIAAEIQRNLLPKDGPHYRGVSFSAHFEPTASIGGDYYDLFSLQKNRLAVAIGDVSGHGLSTGLVMAMVKAAITTLVEQGTDEHSVFQRLNTLVVRSTDRRTFMTLGFTMFDLTRKTLRHTNAGHLYPYLLRKGRPPIALEGPSLPLGVRDDIKPRTFEMALEEQDTLVYLSDGIIEAQSPEGEPFGFESLERLLVHLPGSSPADIQSTVLDAVAEHAGGRLADDDRTIMVLRFDNLSQLPDPLTEEMITDGARV